MGSMTELHGWFTLEYSDRQDREEIDREGDERMPGIICELREFIARQHYRYTEVAVIENPYGMCFLAVNGFSWRADELLKVQDLIGEVKKRAPGSYGCLYDLNHDHDTVKVDVLRRGTLTRCADNFFAPLYPSIFAP